MPFSIPTGGRSASGIPIFGCSNPTIGTWRSGNGSVVTATGSGAASFVTNGGKLTVTNTPGTSINWQSFNIGKGNTVQFVQQSSASMVFNRVTGSTPSSILGNLISNGKVFLINPNGITIGTGAYIYTAAFVASSKFASRSR